MGKVFSVKEKSGICEKVKEASGNYKLVRQLFCESEN